MENQDAVKWSAVGVGLAVLWVAYLVFFGPAGSRSLGGLAPPDLARARAVGVADFTWPTRDLDDKPVDFAQFRGRPILLNVWATWCPPCRAEMPSLAALANNPRIKAKEVAVICVSEEPGATIRSYLAGNDWGMTMLRADTTPAVFTTDGIPATFLISPEGKIVAAEVGAARWDEPGVVEFLEKLAPAAR